MPQTKTKALTRDVTIFPIHDAVHHPGPRDTFAGCLDSGRAFSTELPGGAYLESIRTAVRRGGLKLGPGHYLLLEFSDDIEEFQGLTFTVYESGEIIAQCMSDAHISMATWPPKKLRV